MVAVGAGDAVEVDSTNTVAVAVEAGVLVGGMGVLDAVAVDVGSGDGVSVTVLVAVGRGEAVTVGVDVFTGAIIGMTARKFAGSKSGTKKNTPAPARTNSRITNLNFF